MLDRGKKLIIKKDSMDLRIKNSVSNKKTNALKIK